MKIAYKNLVPFLIIAIIVGAFALRSGSGELFKGQLSTNINKQEEAKLPDLVPSIEIIMPEQKEGDIKVSATIENMGEGQLNGETFGYSIEVNGTEILNNSDSYSEMLPGDSFNFIYPIPRSIYQYPNEGNISLVLDKGNMVKEANEDNNSITEEYSY